MRCNSGRFG